MHQTKHVLPKDGPTELFECGIGLKQGCLESPLLFSLHLDEEEEEEEEFHYVHTGSKGL